MSENLIPVPGRLKNVAVGGHIAGANDIIDDNLNKTQDVINGETYRKSETYSKTELNNLITTPNQEYVSVTATDQTTAVEDVLPATGTADTIYRVGNWDGTQYEEGCYSEYAWNGSSYIKLSKKQPGIDDEPTAGSNNLVKSGGVFDRIQYSDNQTLDIREEGIEYIANINGYYASGVGPQQPSGSYASTELIPIIPGKSYIVESNTASSTIDKAGWYDVNGNYIGRRSGDSSIVTVIIPSNAFFVRFTTQKSSPKIILKATDSDVASVAKVIHHNKFNYSDIESNKLVDLDGNIVPVSQNAAYKLVKLYLKAGRYWICSPGCGNGTHAALTKYTDSSYSSTGSTRIIGAIDAPFSQIVDLNEGYYIFSWNINIGGQLLESNSYGLAFITDANVVGQLIQRDSLPLKNSTNLITSGGVFNSLKNVTGFGCPIQSFADFVVSNNGWTKVSNKEVVSLGNNGVNYKISYPGDLYDDEFRMQIVATPTADDASGYYEVVFGRYADKGTAVIIGNDVNGKHVSVITYNGTTEVVVARQDISTLRFGLNKPLSVVLSMKKDDTCYFTLSICDAAGNTVNVDRINGLTGINVGAGTGHGEITAYTKSGTWSLKGISYGYEKDSSDIKLIIVGHSFVEGYNSTVVNLDKRFSALLSNDIGKDKSIIFGRGGAGVSIFNQLIKQINWYKSTRYVLICIGGNDTDTETTTTAFQAFNDNLSNLGVKPVWLTVSPLKDGTEFNVMNNYIKSHFDFIDITNIFYNSDDTINTSMYNGGASGSDNIHPSIEAYRRMYEVIKNQGSYFFEI